MIARNLAAGAIRLTALAGAIYLTTLAGAVVAVLFLPATASRSVDSGDGWSLVGPPDVDPAHTVGAFESLATASGVGFRFVVATSSGGDIGCHPPHLVGSSRSDSTLTLDFQWQQRGCADEGGQEFSILVQDIPDSGLGVVFPITAEQECHGAVLYPDGTVTGCAVPQE